MLADERGQVAEVVVPFVSSWVPLPARDRFESRCRVPAHCVLALALVVNPFSKDRFSFTADGASLWHSPRFALELL